MRAQPLLLAVTIFFAANCVNAEEESSIIKPRTEVLDARTKNVVSDPKEYAADRPNQRGMGLDKGINERRQYYSSGGIGKKLWPALRNILLVKNATITRADEHSFYADVTVYLKKDSDVVAVFVSFNDKALYVIPVGGDLAKRNYLRVPFADGRKELIAAAKDALPDDEKIAGLKEE